MRLVRCLAIKIGVLKSLNGESQVKGLKAMKKGMLKGFLFVLIVVLSASDNYAAEKTALKLNLIPGQKYKRVISMEEKISQSIAGQKMDIDHTKTVGLEFEIMNADAKDITSVKVTYRTIQEKTSGTVGNFEYDSTDPNTHEGNPIANTYTAMMGEGFLIKVASNGRIVGLTGLDEMLSQMAEKMVVAEDEMLSKLPPGQCTIDKNKAANRNESQEQLAKRRIEGTNKRYGSREERVKSVKEMLKEHPILAEEHVRLMLLRLMTPFPDEPVHVGDTWADKIDLKAMMLPIVIENVYTLKEDKDSVAVVSSNYERKMEDPAIDYNDGFGKMEIAGSYQRNSEVDKSSGWMIRSKEKLNISGKIKMHGNPQMPQGMTVPITLESTVTVEPTESIATHNILR